MRAIRGIRRSAPIRRVASPEDRLRASLATFVVAAMASLLLGACSGSSGGSAPAACTSDCGATFLTQADVQRVITQAVAEAQARGIAAHVAVVDRVGNVIASYRMNGAPDTVAIASGLPVSGGLDAIPQGTIPSAFSAIAKAITCA